MITHWIESVQACDLYSIAFLWLHPSLLNHPVFVVNRVHFCWTKGTVTNSMEIVLEILTVTMKTFVFHNHQHRPNSQCGPIAIIKMQPHSENSYPTRSRLRPCQSCMTFTWPPTADQNNQNFNCLSLPEQGNTSLPRTTHTTMKGLNWISWNASMQNVKTHYIARKLLRPLLAHSSAW